MSDQKSRISPREKQIQIDQFCLIYFGSGSWNYLTKSEPTHLFDWFGLIGLPIYFIFSISTNREAKLQMWDCECLEKANDRFVEFDSGGRSVELVQSAVEEKMIVWSLCGDRTAMTDTLVRWWLALDGTGKVMPSTWVMADNGGASVVHGGWVFFNLQSSKKKKKKNKGGLKWLQVIRLLLVHRN